MARRLEPADAGFFDNAPWRFDFPGIVSAAPARVWEFLTDNEGWTRWFKNCVECRSTSKPVGGVGSTRYISVNGLQVNEEFIAWEPRRLWAFTAVDLNIPFARRLAERATLTDLGGSKTRVDYRMAVEPAKWARPLRGLIASQAAKSFAESYEALGRLLATT